MRPLPTIEQEGPAGAGAPLLFLHGFMGAAENWRPVMERLGGAGRRLLAVDLPGHGAATGRPPEDYTMEGAAAALAATLDAKETGPVALVGYSMGGRLALYFALSCPERCRALVLESASPGLQTEAERAARRRTDAERARRIEADFRAFLKAWYQMPLFASLGRHGGLVEATIEQRLQNDPAELARSLAGMGTGQQPSLWPRLAEVERPAVMLAGALDAKYRRLTKEMATRSGGRLRRILVKEAGHNIHAEQPARFAECLQPFLRSDAARGRGV